MPITKYSSTDSGAPILDGQAGSLVGVLDGCLVDGYGAKAAAGWTLSYTGTNKRVYRMPVVTNQHYLRVDDNEATNTQYATVRGYEAMTDIDNGTDPFPTLAQDDPVYWHKTKNSGANQADWVLYTNGDIFYMFISDPLQSVTVGFAFGQFETYIAGDVSNTIITGTDHSAAQTQFSLFNDVTVTRIARDENNSVKSMPWTKDFYVGANLNISGKMGSIYPTETYNKIRITPATIPLDDLTNRGFSYGYYPRGKMPGLYLINAKWQEGVKDNGIFEDYMTDQNGVSYDLISESNQLGTTAAVWHLIQTTGEW